MSKIAYGLICIITCISSISVIDADDRNEFKTWLTEIDETNTHEYIEGEYGCIGFSNDLVINASSAGFNVNLVGIIDEHGRHMIVCVWFADNEIEFYDPQTDERMTSYYANDDIDTNYRIFGNYTISNWKHVKWHDIDILWEDII